MSRLDELCARFPEIPRPIVLKTDVLREALKFTPLSLEIGRWAIPEFLPWDPEIHKDYEAIAGELVSEDWAWLPHSMTFPEGITAKVLYDFIRHHTSPYEMRKKDGGVWLFRDEEPLVAITFEKRPQWLSQRTPDGHRMASLFVLSSPDRLLGFPIRFCAYYQPDEICRFCCLNPAGKNIAKGDGLHDVIMSEEAAASSFAAALEEMEIRHLTLTGGAVRDQKKEVDIYTRVVKSLARVREEKGANVSFQVMSTAQDEEGQRRLQEAGVDEVCFNMEVWEERLWPEIVPGKERHIGRAAWMKRLQKAAERFGRNAVSCQFVIGVEMVAGGFSTYAEGLKSALEGIEWCAQNGVNPRTHIWCQTPGSLYEPKTAPPTEYFLTIGLERHKILEKYGLNSSDGGGRVYTTTCHRCGYLSPDADYTWLLGSGRTGERQRNETAAAAVPQ